MTYKRKIRRKSKLQQRRQRKLKQREQCRLDHRSIIRKRLHEPLIGKNIREEVKIKESNSNKFLIRDQMKKVISIRKNYFESSDPLNHEMETAPLKDELKHNPLYNGIVVVSHKGKLISNS